LQRHLQRRRLTGREQRRLLAGDLEVVLDLALVRDLEDHEAMRCALGRERELVLRRTHAHRGRGLALCPGKRVRSDHEQPREQREDRQTFHIASESITRPRYALAVSATARLTGAQR